jgi:hypothetical protein
MGRKCVAGCGNNAATAEDIVPVWLANLIKKSDLNLKLYSADAIDDQKQLLRQHPLNRFLVNNVCAACNNGWMSRLEKQAKPLLLKLMNEVGSVGSLTPNEKMTVSRWLMKTAFMISSAQPISEPLPWELFRRLRADESAVPEGCYIFVGHLPGLPDGFTYNYLREFLPSLNDIIQIKFGMHVQRAHFVVVLPILGSKRILRYEPRIHSPLWPPDAPTYKRSVVLPPSFDSVNKMVFYLSNLVEATIPASGAVPAPA